MNSGLLPALAVRSSALLCLLVLAGCGPSVEERKRTVASTSDQAVLARMAIDDGDDGIRKMAVARLSDQTLLAKVATEAFADEIPTAAIARLSDQGILAKIATEASSNPIREAAVAKLTDQAALYRVACQDKELPIRTLAIGRLVDQLLLTKLATEQLAAAIRQAAISRVTDHEFLLLRSRVDSSNAVRMAAVEAMKQQAYLARVAIENDSQAQREAARWRVDEPSLRRQMEIADHERAVELAAIENQADDWALAQAALQGRFDVLRLAAARRLDEQAALGKVVSETRDREVCKIVFGKLTDKKILLEVAGRAPDNAVRIAASLKAGQTTWAKVFDKASSRGSGPVALGEALAAVDLFPEQADAKEGVVQACLNFIRRGDETRIPELVDVLDLYGDVPLAEDYLNCGQPDLDTAGRQWASKRGYNVGTGAGSHRAAWGSDK